MKLGFSTQNVSAKSFIELCNIASEYGFSGFEIYDMKSEIKLHDDSILKKGSVADSKRKLLNRHISVPAVTFPHKVGGKQDFSDELM